MRAAKLLACVLALGATTAFGQAAAPEKAASAAEKGSVTDVLKQLAEVDLSVPTSPAFAVLGIAPNAIDRPGTTRELASAIAKGFDRNGRVVNGLALDFAPLPLFAEEMLKGGIETYEKDFLVQALARTTLSVATADAGTASKMAWGIRVGLYDRGDPGLHSADLASCIRSSKVFPKPPPKGRTVDEEPSAEDAKKTAAAVKSCDVTRRLGLWAEPALYAGYGESWLSETGALKDKTPAARAAWVTWSRGRELGSMRALLQLHGERKRDDRVADKDDPSKLVRQDGTSLVARVRLGAEDWHAFVDVGRSRVRTGAELSSNVRQTGVGLERRIRDDLWLQVGSNSERGFKDGSSQQKVTAGLRFGSEPFLATPGPK